ncbi:hypothetical protein DICPUDRAFT_89506 [Dictyostelium purpureum]|uniref:Coiled-coil domain-containing protein 86 n=1 Tax=Dictyostelium purpureum TaxID=5786 RepID=F0ZWB0_DICPU|nr:uncharacterized protein DICPUDRAFT_89506 [Dictyostelium purpureum]EGC31778.1 hypothetical protein DICPUDRAFT_89506 [Dictyostelium purpureum]|eukprot:XP_003291701.1 hypothetical protein DICPUDRAFT_89506 [Dictyostelium purpureum]
MDTDIIEIQKPKPVDPVETIVVPEITENEKEEIKKQQEEEEQDQQQEDEDNKIVPEIKKEENNTVNNNNNDDDNTKKVSNVKRGVCQIQGPTRGKPVSGRVWKTPSTKFNSAIKVNKGLQTTFEQKQKQREDLKRMKEKQNEIREKTKQDKIDMHNSIRENKKIKEENIKKSEQVQVINNTLKLKKLSKKDWKLYRKN